METMQTRLLLECRAAVWQRQRCNTHIVVSLHRVTARVEVHTVASMLKTRDICQHIVMKISTFLVGAGHRSAKAAVVICPKAIFTSVVMDCRKFSVVSDATETVEKQAA